MGNPNFGFHKVKREKCKASILIEGLSGSGKSGLALIIAKSLAGDWPSVYDIDTENHSLALYDGIDCSLGDKFGDFNVADFSGDIGFRPSNYLLFRDAAIANGCKALIQDSITHAWSADGGILDLVSKAKESGNKLYAKDSYAAWGEPTVVKEKNLLMQLFRDNRCHIISTVRVKEKMEHDTDANGKTILRSLGEQQIMQADVKYEPDLVLTMVEPGSKNKAPRAKVSKSRYAFLEKEMTYDFTPALLKQLHDYLEEGTSPEEIKDQQTQEYIRAVKDFLDNDKTKVALWKQLKKAAGFEDVALEKMPLEAIRSIYTALTN